MLEGKLTVKGHVRLTEEIDREIEVISELEHRPKQDQTRVLIVLGILAWRKGQRGFSRRAVTHHAAQQELAMTPIAAKRRTAPREKLVG